MSAPVPLKKIQHWLHNDDHNAVIRWVQAGKDGDSIHQRIRGIFNHAWFSKSWRVLLALSTAFPEEMDYCPLGDNPGLTSFPEQFASSFFHLKRLGTREHEGAPDLTLYAMYLSLCFKFQQRGWNPSLQFAQNLLRDHTHFETLLRPFLPLLGNIRGDAWLGHRAWADYVIEIPGPVGDFLWNHLLNTPSLGLQGSHPTGWAEFILSRPFHGREVAFTRLGVALVSGRLTSDMPNAFTFDALEQHLEKYKKHMLSSNGEDLSAALNDWLAWASKTTLCHSPEVQSFFSSQHVSPCKAKVVAL